ncbi:MAG: Ig-like domain-containing protein [Actinomadura sp.]
MGIVLALTAAACSGQSSEDAAPPAKVNIAPGDGEGKVRPDSAITVQVSDGALQDVTVTTKGAAVEGEQSADGSRWESRWTLDPDSRYEVIATALGKDGRTKTATSAFHTLDPTGVIATTIEAPYNDEKVGVGMPIILKFDRDVADKKAVERALEVRSSRPMVGSWSWFGDQEVVFRTKEHWPAHTRVEFVAHMSGVQAAKNTYGNKNLKLKFTIGDEHSSVAGEDSHRMIVMSNGKKIKDIPISMGRGGIEKYTTTNGNHLTMEKADSVVMDSATVGCPPGCPDYYNQTVYWTVRISNSGEYAHSAPWSVGSQGSDNVSHGCVNMSEDNAIWFYKFSYRGDPYKITGSDRELEPDNGWGFWQLSWKDWLKKGALKQPITTGRLSVPPASVAGSASRLPEAGARPGRAPHGSATPSP